MWSRHFELADSVSGAVRMPPLIAERISDNAETASSTEHFPAASST